MGNKESEQKKEFEVEINHPRFSKSKIISNTSSKLLQTTQSIDEKEYDKWKASLLKYQGSIPHNLLLPVSHSFNRTGLCGNTGTVLLNYDNYPYLLTEEIYNRRGKKGKFLETELWFLIFSYVEARKEANLAGEKLGDIRPKNTFLNEDGKIKVSNSLTWPLEISNIQKSFDKIPTYLAPEDLLRIQKGEAFDSPTDQAQAFSIGLSALSAANLTDYEDLYNLKANELNLVAFNEALAQFAQNNFYSIVLRGAVLLLLNIDPNRRLTCVQLNDLLAKHANLISKKQNFFIDNAPQKLHEQIQQLNKMLATVPVLQPLITSEYKFDKGNIRGYE